MTSTLCYARCRRCYRYRRRVTTIVDADFATLTLSLLPLRLDAVSANINVFSNVDVSDNRRRAYYRGRRSCCAADVYVIVADVDALPPLTLAVLIADVEVVAFLF